ncbi:MULTISPECIES: RES family NAD+ phosphorylase [Sphingomonas]|uniref:RES family NAD+ phosphorylase n=1 Tax=Sphingomonas TaxID=13687 RepID=UPI000DF01DC0|nr:MULTISPECIES: RES family NAD+ phosphorylase [Sphingomonas]
MAALTRWWRLCANCGTGSLPDSGSRPHDPDLLDLLAGYTVQPFAGVVWRATRLSQDPTAFSYRGGRWAPPSSYQSVPVLYTSCERDGAIAEMSSWLALLTPPPTKPVLIHKLTVRAEQVITLDEADLTRLGIDARTYDTRSYVGMGEAPPSRTQEIGAAISFLGVDGLRVPSARWSCDNVILYDNLDLAFAIDVEETLEVSWTEWRELNLPDG